MQQIQPCKIELKWPACCPRCGMDLRVAPMISSSVNPMEQVSPATIVLEEPAKWFAQETSTKDKPTDVEEQIDMSIIVGSQIDVPVASQTIKPVTLPLTGRIAIASMGEILPLSTAVVPVPPPLPAEEMKQETPPPPPPSPTPEPEVEISKQERYHQEQATTATDHSQNQSMSEQIIDQYYDLLPTPTQVAFSAQPPPIPNPVQFGQIILNPPPMMVSQQQAQHQPVWTSQPAQQQQVQIGPCYQTSNWYRPQSLPSPTPRFVQFSAPPPVNFPFPPPTMTMPFQHQQQHLPGLGQAPMVHPTMVPGSGVFTIQHHYLNVLPGQFQP